MKKHYTYDKYGKLIQVLNLIFKGKVITKKGVKLSISLPKIKK